MKLNLTQWLEQTCDRRWRLTAIAAGMLGMSLLSIPAIAVQFSDGTVQFAGVPRLGKVTTTDNQASAWGATYLFTLQVPDDASEPLGRVVLRQEEGLDAVEFNLGRTYAYLNGDRTQTTAVESIKPKPDTLELTFTPPIPPGTSVTLGLRPYSNPRTGGVYLFGVTTAPAGDKVRDQFIGYGRLQFYDRSFWHRF